jgi:hypothetical protein
MPAANDPQRERTNLTASELLRHGGGKSVVLSIDGQYTFEVGDDVSRAKLLELVDRLEAIAGIQRGLDDLEAGRVTNLVDLSDRGGRSRFQFGWPGV